MLPHIVRYNCLSAYRRNGTDMDMKNSFPPTNPDCRDPYVYTQTISHLREIYHNRGQAMQKVEKLAVKVREGIKTISPLIQKSTHAICPCCKEICCINKHGYYNYEDLIYLHALGLNPTPPAAGIKDSDPCRFLGASGCIMERHMRPSGCNWYFCDPLLEHIEETPEYHKFDESLRDIAEMWMKMIEEFKDISGIPSS